MNPNFMWITALLIFLILIGICAMAFEVRKIMERYIKLEEWAENWLKRLEYRVEACESAHKNMENLLPKDGNGEIIRNQILLQQMNDEMERSLKMEKDWNDGLMSILNYGKPNAEVNKNE